MIRLIVISESTVYAVRLVWWYDLYKEIRYIILTCQYEIFQDDSEKIFQDDSEKM